MNRLLGEIWTFKISGEGSEENDEHDVENMYHFELIVDRYVNLKSVLEDSDRNEKHVIGNQRGGILIQWKKA